MNKKITAFIIIASILLLVFVACTDMDPLGIANGVPEGYEVDALVTGDWIYFAEGSDIKRMSLTGTDVETVFTVNYTEIKKIQVDSGNQKIYILESLTGIKNLIHKHNLFDGSGEKIVIDTADADIADMTVDSINGLLYYINIITGIRKVFLNDDPVSDVNVLNGARTLSASIAYDSLDPTLTYYLEHEPDHIHQVTAGVDGGNYADTWEDGSGLVFNTLDKFFYFHVQSGNVLKKMQADEVGEAAHDTGVTSITGSLVLYPTDSKVFYFSSGAEKRLYSINMDYNADP
ncbi:MAG: hypothetical protein U9N32_03945, partial [Spirochaetota bacterium]|nr:hypothetical protein [Spirochaetota bacterium]